MQLIVSVFQHSSWMITHSTNCMNIAGISQLLNCGFALQLVVVARLAISYILTMINIHQNSTLRLAKSDNYMQQQVQIVKLTRLAKSTVSTHISNSILLCFYFTVHGGSSSFVFAFALEWTWDTAANRQHQNAYHSYPEGAHTYGCIHVEMKTALNIGVVSGAVCMCIHIHIHSRSISPNGLLNEFHPVIWQLPLCHHVQAKHALPRKRNCYPARTAWYNLMS